MVLSTQYLQIRKENEMSCYELIFLRKMLLFRVGGAGGGGGGGGEGKGIF